MSGENYLVKYALVPVESMNHYKIPSTLPRCCQLYNWLMESERKTHPTVALGTLLTTISAITSRKYYSETDCSSTLYLIVIAQTAMGKNMLVNTPKRILKMISLDKKIVSSGVSSEGAIDAIFSEQPAFTQVIDEFGDQLGHMLNDKGGYLQAVKTKMKALYGLTNGIYESGRYSNSGGKHKMPKAWGLDRPCYGITGATTKMQLLKHLKEEMLHDGFLNRFIILNGEQFNPYFPTTVNKHLPKDLEDHIFSIPVDMLNYASGNKYKSSQDDSNDTEYDEEKKCYIPKTSTINFYNMLSNDVKSEIAQKKEQIDGSIIHIPFTKDARAYLEYIGDADIKGTDIYDFCKEDLSDVKRAISGRWAENAIRISLALSAFEKHKHIQKETLIWAYTLVKQTSIDFMNLFEQESSVSRFETKKEKAIQWFMSKGKSNQFSLSELARNSRPFSSIPSKERLELLNELVTAEIIKLEYDNGVKYYSLI